MANELGMLLGMPPGVDQSNGYLAEPPPSFMPKEEPQAPMPPGARTTGGIVPPATTRWGQFLQNIKTDPNLRMALMQTGAAMMQSPRFGENVGDVIGRAAQTGIMTLDTLRQRDRAQKEREEDRKFQRENESARTGAYVKTADAQIGESTERKKKLEWENSPQYREIVMEELKLGKSVKEAQAKADSARARYYDAAGRSEDAQAALYGRTDPNIRGSGKDTDLQVTIDTLTQEKIDAGVEPGKAKADATREAWKMKGQRDEQFRFSKAVNDRAAMNDPLLFTKSPQEQAAALEEARQQVLTEQAQSGQRDRAVGLEKTAKLATKHKGKSVTVSYVDPTTKQAAPKVGKVVGVDPTGGVQIIFPDGSKDILTPDELVQELGE
jgi:hypothetical protein